MNDFQTIADRVEIEALRGEFTDTAMMRDRPRMASLFTPDGALRMPNIPVELVGREEIRAGGERLQSQWDFFVQTTHPGTIVLDGDTATGRAYIQELARTLDGRQGLNYAVYHDRYQRTEEGWKFAERVYEVRYLDTSPLAGKAPHAASGSGTSPAEATATPAPAASFAGPASAERLERAAAALRAGGFAAEILDDAAAARARVKDLVPEGASVLTGASETLRLSGIDDDINTGGRYDAVRPRVQAIDRATGADEIRRLVAGPEFVVNSVAAVTETGSLVLASGSGSQLPANAGGAAHAVWIVGAQKVVPDLSTALRRVEEHALPLENIRAQEVYGRPSAVNRLLILNAEPHPGRGTVLLLREAIGY
ncbi:nuclear transport factor 2 family protein [Streptomyces violarus]|uniref:Ketosteroid isomerase-like protein n=1 Tax=Streptomyces violarus TaxID=67380 RepID=A0A7W4ZSN5_9ACTN|nr:MULTISPECIES: nuclear transport factor 2 family protein [Streptomyces]MBB3077994.1 ketosteroid isomerase-like protein [Streptomyces violarus]WRT99839.1 nuclear transport factor 2 family protein [Streptomyces sp. CGMCC 4.1772]